MDGRKLVLLGGMALLGLVGCTRQETVKNNDPYISTGVGGASKTADSTARKVEPKEPSKVLDAKPETCVKLGDIQADLALDKSRSDEDRALSAKHAKDAYKRALQLDPKCLSAYIGLGRLCSWLNEYDQAMAAYDAALAKQPKQPSLWYERGMCLARQKRFDESLSNLTKASQLDSSSAQYSKGVGLMLARLGRTDEAIKWLAKSMPEADARYNAARMLEHLGREEESRLQLQLALKANPTHQASLEMLTGEIAHEPAPVQLASHQPDLMPDIGAGPPLTIQVGPTGSALPQRPDPVAAVDANLLRPAPVIPVVSDQWEQKPPPPSSLEGPHRAPRIKSKVDIGFDPNS